MILKKYQARRLRPANDSGYDNSLDNTASQRRGNSSRGDFSAYDVPANDSNPYASQPLNSELFDQGVLVDRRRRGERRDDRRQDFRRNDDHALISTAEREGEFLREQAQKDGYTAGLAEGKAMLEALEQHIADFLQAREKALESASDDIADIALEVVRHILKTEVSCDPDLVVSFVKRAVRDVSRQHKSVTVRLHPADYSLLSERYGDDTPLLANVDVGFIEDDTVDPGSCIVETVAGQIDKRFSTQIEVLETLLKQRLGNLQHDDTSSDNEMGF
jgi:flagellar biosynthesis/type III secretory pathway protein FliH